MFALVNENGVVIADSITGQSIFEETPNSDETDDDAFWHSGAGNVLCVLYLSVQFIEWSFVFPAGS